MSTFQIENNKALSNLDYHTPVPFHKILEHFLQEAKETLCDPEKRAIYDKWRNSGISMSYKQWLGMKEHVGQVRRYTIAEKVDKEVCVWARNSANQRSSRPVSFTPCLALSHSHYSIVRHKGIPVFVYYFRPLSTDQTLGLIEV